MMKRLLYVCIFALLLAPFSGCSDSDSGSPPDVLQEFRNAADDLWTVYYDAWLQVGYDFAETEDENYGKAFVDLGVFRNCTSVAFDAAAQFTISRQSNGVYTDTDGHTTITVSGNVYVLSMKVSKSFEAGTTEVIQIDFTYNIATNRWLVVSYRGGTSTSDPTVLWLKQEGEILGDSYYIATTYYLEENTTDPRRISNLIYTDGTPSPTIQMAVEASPCAADCVTLGVTALYTNGVVAASLDTWANFRTYNITGDVGATNYEIPVL